LSGTDRAPPSARGPATGGNDRALHVARTLRGRHGDDAILFTARPLGPCIDAVAREHAPTRCSANEAMIEQAPQKAQDRLLAPSRRRSFRCRGISPLRRDRAKLAAGALAALGGKTNLRVSARTRSHGGGSGTGLRGLRCDRARAIQMAPGGGRLSPSSGRPVLRTGQRRAEVKELLSA